MELIELPDSYERPLIDISGPDGNAFFIVGMVQRAMREAKVPSEEIARYLEEATSGDYENLCAVSSNYADLF